MDQATTASHLCPDLLRLIPEGGMAEWLHSIHKQYFIVKGHIQSGKTNFMIGASSIFLKAGFDVLIVTRNSRADREQLLSRMQATIQPPYPTVALANHANLSRARALLTRSYVVFLDEVDAIDSGRDAKKNATIAEIKAEAHCCFGVSGTVMDVIGKQAEGKMILISTPPRYKGVFNHKIRMDPFFSDQSRYSSKVTDDLFERTELLRFIEHYMALPPLPGHPRICLITVTDCVRPYQNARDTISYLYPSITTVVYNGMGIKVETGSKQRDLRDDEDDEDDIQDVQGSSISEVLQRLKEEGVERHPVILIMAGELAGRGISFVSNDRGWHLTDQVLLVSKTTDEPELLQKIRLCGVYDDDLPLTLYSTDENLSDVRKACFRQEEYLEAITRESDASLAGSTRSARQIVEDTEMSYSKFSSRRMTKDVNAKMSLRKTIDPVGWSDRVYHQIELPPNPILEAYGIDRVDRLDRPERVEHHHPVEKDKGKGDAEKIRDVNLKKDESLLQGIQKVLRGDRPTKEQTFLRSIDPSRVYHREEIIERLVEAAYLQPANMWKAMTSPNETWGKRYFDNVEEGWRIRECLRAGWVT